jgi:hypothetical protein
MVASSLGTILLAAVLSAFLFLVRSGLALGNYQQMETEARAAMELFAQDVRRAHDVAWASSRSVTVQYMEGSTARSCTYTYVPASGTFTRTRDGVTRVIVSGIDAFAFTAYQIDTSAIDLSAPTSATDRATKQIQISLSARRNVRTFSTNTNQVISARFILRNKRVTA